MFNITEHQHYTLKLFENKPWYYYEIIQYLNLRNQNHILNDSSIFELRHKGFLNTYYDNNRISFFTINNVGKEFLIQLELFKNQNRITNEVKAPEIFFSYAWGDEKEIGESRETIVNNLYESLKDDKYVVVRDKVDLGYKGLISDFMIRIGKGDFIVVAISDKYLKSPYCMYELYEVYRNSKLEAKGFIDKIYPIRVEQLNLNSPKILSEYFQFWQNLEKEWEDLIVTFGTRITVAQKSEYDKIKEIAAKLGDLLDVLKDMNSLTKQILSNDNFAEIKKAIEERTKN